jgi:predicted dehydrogenase
VNETGRIYMIGETSSYYPGAIYCRHRFVEGAFGKVVFSEGEYFHDWDHGLYDVMKWRGGDKWLEEAGSPPMYYPTHSTGGIVSILKARMTHVSCQGFADDHEDGIYAPGANRYDNRFSCQSALFHMSDGSMCRINEFRRIGHPSVERMSMYGTEGCFQNSLGGEIWTDKDGVTRLDDLLRCGKHDGFNDMSLVHEIQRLPKSFRGLSNGHQGSHQFLVDDFVKAAISGVHPLNSVWQAARS